MNDYMEGKARKKILTDDNFVLSEAQKLQYLYTLKHIIRYGQTRSHDDYTESVAEHIYGMHILVDYFLPLEFAEDALNKTRLSELITWHELGEIETGDIPALHKTNADRAKERALLPHIIENTPSHMHEYIADVSKEYEEQETAESRFVKAIDKIEPLIHSFHPLGKHTQTQLKLTTAASIAVKQKHIADYKTIERFSTVLHTHMDAQGYFYADA